MNTKELIEFCEEYIKDAEAGMYINFGYKDIKTFKDIKALLQCWEELYEIASEFNFFPLMDKLKQKYSPEQK